MFARKRKLVGAVRIPFKDWIKLSDVQEPSFIMQKGLQVTLIVSARISTTWILYMYGIKDSRTYEDIKTIVPWASLYVHVPISDCAYDSTFNISVWISLELYRDH